jgi:hypothetical protein
MHISCYMPYAPYGVTTPLLHVRWMMIVYVFGWCDGSGK